MYVCHLCKEERPGTGMESPVGKGAVCSFCYEELMKEVEFLQERAARQAEFDAGICRCCGHVFPIEDMFVVCDGGEQYRACTKCFDKIYFEEEIQMTQELDRFAEELEEDYEDELEAGRIRDEQRNDDVLKAPSHIELALDREQAEDVDEERFHAGENYIHECYACGFVFEVQDLIPIDRHGGVVYFCEKCFEEEYHAGM